jgi:HSP20 family protein
MTMLRPTVFSLSPLSQQFDEMFKSMFAPAGRVASRSFPPLNAWEDEKNVIAEAELPGFKMEDLEITMTGRELTIRGKRTIERPEGASPLMSERGEGEFVRTVRLGVPVDADKVTASLRDGVLTITLPKSEAAKPRRIAVNASNN